MAKITKALAKQGIKMIPMNQKKENHMKKIFLATVFLLFFANLCFADLPPAWSNFEIKSENDKYVAKVGQKDVKTDVPAWLRGYTLTVFSINEQSARHLWSTDYNYDGYSGGILSSDGTTFAYVNFWFYKDAPVVTIYRNGRKTAQLNGNEFHIEPSKLMKTVSHQLWLREDGASYRFVNTNDSPLILEIHTIDNQKHQIDVETSTLLK